MQKVIRTRPGLNPHPHDDRGLMSATRPPGGLISSTHNMSLEPRRRTDRTPEQHRIACTCAWRVRERRWYCGPRYPFNGYTCSAVPPPLAHGWFLFHSAK